MNIALIGPNFFSYIQSISHELTRHGFISLFFDERHSNSITAKILYRVGYYNIFENKKRIHLDNILYKLLEHNVTHVLLVDVEVCDRDFIIKLKKLNIFVALYMWDSAKNKPNYIKFLDLLDAKASFDPGDCIKYSLKYIPLFSEYGILSDSQNVNRIIDIYFCGTLHSSRSKIIYDISKYACIRGIKYISYNYYHSKILFFLKSIFNLSGLYLLPTIKDHPISKNDIYANMLNSKFVLDMQHSAQKGLTARTFEALRSGAYLLTTNPYANLLPLNLNQRIVVFQKCTDLDIVDFENYNFVPLTEEQDHYLSIGRFADDILLLLGSGSID